MKTMIKSKLTAIIVSGAMIFGSVCTLPSLSISALAISKTDTNEGTICDCTFKIPAAWEYDDESEPEEGEVYYYAGEYEELPMLYLETAAIDEDLSKSSESGMLKRLEKGKKALLAEDVYDAWDISESTQATIAGFPGIVFDFKMNVSVDCDARCALFADTETSLLYMILIIEEEDSNPSYLDDMDYILSSFSKGEAPTGNVSSDTLAEDVYNALQATESYSTDSVLTLGEAIEIEEGGATASIDMNIVMNENLEALVADPMSFHLTMGVAMAMEYEVLGETESMDESATNEFYFITDKDGHVSTYVLEDGDTEWDVDEYDADDLDDEDYQEMNKMAEGISDFAFFKALADGTIESEVDEATDTIDGKEVFVMYADLDADGMDAALSSLFLITGDMFDEDEIDLSKVKGEAVIYIDTETFLPVRVEIETPGFTEALFDAIGMGDVVGEGGSLTVTAGSLVTDFLGFDEIDEIKAPVN